MSYSVEWIDPIYDRTYGDILAGDSKGYYNATDLNRLENNTKYIAEDMLARKIVRIPFNFSYKLNWQANEVPTKEDMARIIQNILILMASCNPTIEKDLEAIHTTNQMTYALANDLEYNLEVLKNQPELPIQSFLLTINNGYIQDYNNPDYIPENEIVTIGGIPYGESAQYMVFDHWSGSAEDLACLGDTESQITTIEMPYRDVELTAVFKVRFPRTLTLTNAVINDSIGGSTRIFFAGDEVPILADVAEYGKRMYCWTGTEEALELIQGGEEPSTSILTMPDMDVELAPFYINAGQHSVTITDTDGRTVISQEWYDYGDYVTISAPSKGSKYRFASWSGDTSYLEDITDSISSFNMGDVNIRFTPTYTYVYGYHDATGDNNCLLNGEYSLENVMESSIIQLSLDSDYESSLDENSWFDYYEITYNGNSYTVKQQNTNITMPDYDITVTVNSNTPSTLTVQNLNNSGQVTTYQGLGDRYIELSTSNTVGQYVFIGWYKNGNKLSSNTYYRYTFDYEVLTDEIEAVYEYREYHTITIHNRNDLGGTETQQVLDGFEVSISTLEIVGNDIVDKWYFDGSSIGIKEGDTSWSAKVWNDMDIVIAYRVRETYTLTVENGAIDGGGTTYTGLERTSTTIIADSPANKKIFSRWSTDSGSVYKYGSVYSSTTTVHLGRSDATVVANYDDLYDLTVNTSDGVALQGQYKNGTKVTLPSSTMANSDTEWDKWNIYSGIISILNIFLMRSEAYTGNEDTIVNASYKSIPYFTCTIQNGHFSDNSTTKQIKRNDSPIIIMNPAPLGMKFLMWEIITGNDTDVSAPLAETSSLNNVTHNITVEAIYYVPDDSVKYNMSITNKNGVTTITSHSVGDEIQIRADEPDEGYEFYRWVGDISYLTDRYSATTVVRMPNKNISLSMLYRLEGATILYHVSLSGGKMIIGEQGGEPVWDVDGEFEEGSVVRIKADEIPIGWEFYRWYSLDENSLTTVTDLSSPDTTLTVSTFDITLDVDMEQQTTRRLIVENGEVSGSYLPGAPATVFFNKENTNKIKYTFTRWSGDTNLTLFGGGTFDIYDSGDYGESPQIIVMPDNHTIITGEYTTEYKVTINNGTVDGETSDYFSEGDTATIQADTVQGKVFQKWEGDTEYVDAIYSSTTTITIPDDGIILSAKYVDENDPNGIGYVWTNIYDNDIINIENINIISGTIQEGFIITDINGHLYVVISVNANTVNILRLTKKTGGADNG